MSHSLYSFPSARELLSHGVCLYLTSDRFLDARSSYIRLLRGTSCSFAYHEGNDRDTTCESPSLMVLFPQINMDTSSHNSASSRWTASPVDLSLHNSVVPLNYTSSTGRQSGLVPNSCQIVPMCNLKNFHFRSQLKIKFAAVTERERDVHVNRI